MTIETRIVREIEDLHAFFQRWFRGKPTATEDAFSRPEQALAENFTLVTPDGQEIKRTALINNLRESRGCKPTIRIWIEQPGLIHHQDKVVIARYDECQQENNTDTRRTSTVVFLEHDGKPNNLIWLRVHETWRAK